MASKLVAFRLPDDIVRAIESEAQATGKDKTAVVVKALRQVFEVQTVRSPTVEGLQQQVDDLEHRVTQLTEQLSHITDMFLRTEILR
jgi:polyhydroxyalkanoate synthesis regulator phasin